MRSTTALRAGLALAMTMPMAMPMAMPMGITRRRLPLPVDVLLPKELQLLKNDADSVLLVGKTASNCHNAVLLLSLLLPRAQNLDLSSAGARSDLADHRSSSPNQLSDVGVLNQTLDHILLMLIPRKELMAPSHYKDKRVLNFFELSCYTLDKVNI